MAKAYSKEFRREVLKVCDEGTGTREAAVRFNVSESWVRRIKQERREQGKTAPCTTRQRTPAWAVYAAQIREIFEARPDTTLNELKSELGTELSTKTLCIACQKLKLTLKKSPRRIGTKTPRCRSETSLVASLANQAVSRSTCFSR